MYYSQSIFIVIKSLTMVSAFFRASANNMYTIEIPTTNEPIIIKMVFLQKKSQTEQALQILAIIINPQLSNTLLASPS